MENSTIISIVALAISGVGLVYTARTYAVSHRPYIGIVEIPFQLVEQPPRAIVWKLIVKNLGSVPGFLKIDENSSKLVATDAIFPLPSLGDAGKTGTLVMPGQVVDLLGQYSEVNGPVPMQRILSGEVTLLVAVKLTYRFPSWLWSGRRKYTAELRFDARKGFAPGFIMLSATAN